MEVKPSNSENTPASVEEEVLDDNNTDLDHSAQLTSSREIEDDNDEKRLLRCAKNFFIVC